MKLKPTQSLAVIILPLVLYSCATTKLLAPVIVPTAEIPNVVQPVSDIEVPVTVDLKNYFVQAERSVPNKYTDNQQPCEGLRYQYVFTRTPFTITGSNNVVNLSFTGSYGFAASYCAKCAIFPGTGQTPIVPVISAQCGWAGEQPRRMQISYQSTISITPDYHLRSKTILYPAPKPLDRCNVVMGTIDVTDRLIQYISDPLNDLGKQVDARIAAYNIRPMVEQIWKNLSTESKAGDMGYVYINPESVRLSSFNLNGSSLTFSVGLSAKPVFTTVSTQRSIKPLPNLSAYTPANGFNVYLDLHENYDHLTKTVNQQVAGMKADVAGKEFIVDNTKIWGSGKQVVMQVDFKGSSTGTIYLIGTPNYDAKTHELSFPDLSFDLQTKAWMLKAAKWMFNGKITDMIRQRATYNITQFLVDSKTRIQKEMSRDIGNGIRSDVLIHDLDIQAIYPTNEQLIIRTLSNGQIKVKVVM
ncbi:DUF4403 family protein [Mucilaginibacter ginsenosidivorans]|uniref:DUF4403 family protein n=1 Tax=Mucilaginibacter ginsenosidivorans TaxID=398053 RepID=A0A5B8UZY1_9SPHI|nr:DUF4403 family protein [Mucilaginibacter ginsenosidivorans]QEC64133.1 DUF4403 family protein [Mucilaginibacter ginsenosidivorans]